VLQDTFDTAAARGTWFVEGTQVEESVSDVYTAQTTTSVKIWKSGENWRLETSADTAPRMTLWIKNGTDSWRTSETGNPYEHRRVRRDLRAPLYFRWELFPTLLENATFFTQQLIEVKGKKVECVLIHSQTPNWFQTFYIDTSRMLLLREVWERTEPCNSRHSRTTITYEHIARDLSLDPSLFTFTPRPGATEGDPMTPFVSHAVPAGGDVSVPAPIHVVHPKETSEAAAARPQGKAVVYVEVGPFGVPGRMSVVRGLGGTLDKLALDAVRQWCFLPGSKGGKPVTVSTTVEVSFP
jgi:TonB family protein